MDNQETLFMRHVSDDDIASDQDDVWDDTALIKAYDVAVQAVKDKIALQLESSDTEIKDKTSIKKTLKKSGCLKSKKLEWQIGAACRAVYSEDGKIYEATIQNINHDTNTCLVKYVGYENEEEVLMSQLLVSQGSDARARQEKESGYVVEGDIESSNLHRVGQQPNHLLGKDSIPRKYSESKKHYAKECISNFGSQFPPLHNPPYLGFPTSSNMTYPQMMPTSLPPPPPLSVTSSLPLGDSEALSAMLMSWYMSGFHTGYYQGLQQAKHLNGVAKQTP